MKDFTDLLRQVEKKDEFWVESAKLSFVIELNRLLQTCEMTYADLARRIDRSPAYISKIMAGDTNFTIETLVKLSRAVGCRVDIKLHLKNEKQDSLQFSFDTTTAIPGINPHIFDSFVTEKTYGQVGRFRFPGIQYQGPSNDHRYQDAA